MIHTLDNARLTGDENIEIKSIEYDSRNACEGALFIAISGYEIDGFDFVPQALQKGAVAVMGERDDCSDADTYVKVSNVRKAMADVAAAFYDHPGEKIKACGVTGTNGKTTTCFLLQQILKARNKRTGLITSVVYDTGRETFKAERTTPESLDMQRLLYLMKKNHCVNAVIEVSSHALMLHRVDNINFRVAVFTNLTRDHLDFHKTMEDYFQAKTRLAKKLDGPLSYAVINLDVPEFRPLIGDFSSSYIGFSLENKDADVYTANYELKPEGTVFDLVTPMGTRTIEFQLPGRFNLMNALAAAAGGLAAGVDLDSIVTGLDSASVVPGRLNYVYQGQPFAIYVDYAHTPDAITSLCESVREMTNGKLLILFGCGGDRDKGKRAQMGQAAVSSSDFVIVTSDNPRGEEPDAIINDIKPGLSGGNYEIISGRKEAIAAIIKKAQKGDAVLLAGKGSENYMEIKGERFPFDDMAEAKRALAECGYSAQAIDEEN